MASRILLQPLTTRATYRITTTLVAGTILTSPLILQPYLYPHKQLLFHDHLDTLSQPLSMSSPQTSQYRTASTGRTQRPLNARTVRQITTGSIIGVIGGLAVSLFSKPLAVILGLLVFGVQFLETRGIHLVPYNRLQRQFKDVDVTSLLQENVAFKLSFGATFALAAFAKF